MSVSTVICTGSYRNIGVPVAAALIEPVGASNHPIAEHPAVFSAVKGKGCCSCAGGNVVNWWENIVGKGIRWDNTAAEKNEVGRPRSCRCRPWCYYCLCQKHNMLLICVWN
jgi:hypothetical protein